jgi:hypothetical protein
MDTLISVAVVGKYFRLKYIRTFLALVVKTSALYIKY